MAAPRKYLDELRARSVRLVLDARRTPDPSGGVPADRRATRPARSTTVRLEAPEGRGDAAAKVEHAWSYYHQV